MIKILSFAIFLITAYPAFAANCTPQSYQAFYKITYLGIPIGKSTANFKLAKNNRYQYTLNTKSNLLFMGNSLLESSQGLWHKKHFQPQNYHYRYSNGNKIRNVDVLFNWHKKYVTNVLADQSWKMSILKHTQDKIIYQMELSHDLCIGKKKLAYTIADGGKLKAYSFQVQGPETINTKLGKLETIKIIRNPLLGKRNTTLWLAPKLNYLIVRATQADNHAQLAVAEIIELNMATRKLHGKLHRG